MRPRPRYRPTPAGADPFTDLLFNVLLGFVLLFFVAILFLNPAEDTGRVDIDAEYVVSVTWPDGSPDDIDAYVEDPSGELTWFRHRGGSLVHLDRDDRGALNDTFEVDGVETVNPLNQEIAAVRGKLPGEYTVNVHYYDSVTGLAVPVTVDVARVNPVYSVAYHGTMVLEAKGVEKTAVRFTIGGDGAVRDVNRLPKPLVPK